MPFSRHWQRLRAAWARHGGLGLGLVAAGRLADRLHTRLVALRRGIEIGPGSIIQRGAVISCDGGRIILGAGCLIHRHAHLMAYGGEIRLGDRVSVNPLAMLYGHGGLKIGNDVMIATGSVLIPANHGILAGRPMRVQPLGRRGIEIGDDVWLGAGVRVLDGAVIGQGAVLAAGAVLPAGHVPGDTIMAGVPARPIGRRPAPVQPAERAGECLRLVTVS